MVPLTHESGHAVEKIKILQGIWYVLMSRDRKHLTSSQSIKILKFGYIYLNGFALQIISCTLNYPGGARRVPRRFCKDTVTRPQSNITEAEKEEHG